MYLAQNRMCISCSVDESDIDGIVDFYSKLGFTMLENTDVAGNRCVRF